MKKTSTKRTLYQIGLLAIALVVIAGLAYAQSRQQAPAVIEYTVNNPSPQCSHVAVTPDGVPPTITDKWQTPCQGGYFYLAPYHAIYFEWNDQAYLITKDVISFRVYLQDGSQTYGHDSTNVYHDNERLENANPNTFIPPSTSTN